MVAEKINVFVHRRAGYRLEKKDRSIITFHYRRWAGLSLKAGLGPGAVIWTALPIEQVVGLRPEWILWNEAFAVGRSAGPDLSLLGPLQVETGKCL